MCVYYKLCHRLAHLPTHTHTPLTCTLCMVKHFGIIAYRLLINFILLNDFFYLQWKQQKINCHISRHFQPNRIERTFDRLNEIPDQVSFNFNLQLRNSIFIRIFSTNCAYLRSNEVKYTENWNDNFIFLKWPNLFSLYRSKDEEKHRW